MAGNKLCVRHPVIIISISVITGRTYKLPVKYWNEIVIDIYVLIHTPKNFKMLSFFTPFVLAALMTSLLRKGLF